MPPRHVIAQEGLDRGPAMLIVRGMDRLRALAVAAGLLLATLLLYLPVKDHQFVNCDDDLYVTANPVVAGGLTWRGAAWAFTSSGAGNWHPLAWISHMADVSLFGMRPAGHHLVSAGLHAAAAAALFLALRGLTGAVLPPLLVAALFAAHPLHVESVAWVAERKDVLCAFFWMLALVSHARYARRPSSGRYLATGGFLLCALLAKPMAVTLPLALLVLDWWPLDRVRREGLGRAIREKVPFLVLAAAVGTATLVAQGAGGSLIGTHRLALGARLANATVAAATYLVKTVWPAALAHYYPYPQSGVPAWKLLAAAALLAALTLAAAGAARSRPWLAAGWAWYGVTLAPVIGLVQVGSQAMADRYTYLPLVGIFLAAAWEARAICARRPRRGPVVAAAALCVVAALLPLSRRQLEHWRDSISLSTHAIHVTGDNWFAENSLGTALAALGRHEEALARYRESLRIRPRGVEATNNMGASLLALGRAAEALRWFRHAAQLRPGEPDLHENVARALRRLGREDEAALALEQARGLRRSAGAAR